MSSVWGYFFHKKQVTETTLKGFVTFYRIGTYVSHYVQRQESYDIYYLEIAIRQITLVRNSL